MATSTASTVLERLRFPVRYPQAVLEIDARYVSAVRMKGEKVGGKLLGFGLAPLSEAAVPPTVAAPKIHAPEEVRAAIESAAKSAGLRGGKASLLLPDTAARVGIHQLPELPRKSQAMLDLLRWKVKRSVPFRIEDALIVWQVLTRPTGSAQANVLVGLIPRTIVGAYEAFAAKAGFKIGLVDLSTFNLYNGYRSIIAQTGAGAGDFAVLNATPAYFSLLVFVKGELAFFRCKMHAEADGGGPEERLRTLRREMATSLSYYTEKLSGVGLATTFVRIVDPDLEGTSEVFESLGLGAVQPIEPRRLAALPRDLDETTALALTPAIGAAIGRSA